MQHTAIQQFKIIKIKLERNHNISTQNQRNLKLERNSNREIEIQSTEIRRRNPAKNHGQKNTPHKNLWFRKTEHYFKQHFYKIRCFCSL